MHIVFVDSICNPTSPGIGGLSDINWRLARELVCCGECVTVVGPYNNDVISPYPDIPMIAVPEAIVQHNNIARHLMSTYRLAKVAKQVGKVDIYHVPDSVTAAVLALLGLGAKVLWHGHSNIDHHIQHGNPWDTSMYILMRLATMFATKSIGQVVALGKSLVPWWQQSGFPRNRICVIPNGIDVSSDIFVSKSEKFLSNVWRDCQYRLLYVGRLSAEKGGYLELIDAVSKITTTMSVGLVLIGDGPQRADLENAIKQRGLDQVISCLGYQSPELVNQAYSDANLVILPSRGEMMPRVMLEAWAAATPFMATAVGAIPDYLVDNENGFLLESLDPDYICARLRTILQDAELRKRVAEHGKATAQELSWSYVAARYQEVYRAIVAGSAG